MRNRDRALPWRGAIGLILLTAALQACSSPSNQSRTPPENTRTIVGPPYHAGGKLHHPADSLDYDRTGLASWYGREHHGKRTASGERFDMHAMTAAHPTLAMPTIVRVTNLANRRSIVLRINDRGPFTGNRIIDVSYAAAQALGFARQGAATVRVTVLKSETLRVRQQAVAEGAMPR